MTSAQLSAFYERYPKYKTVPMVNNSPGKDTMDPTELSLQDTPRSYEMWLLPEKAGLALLAKLEAALRAAGAESLVPLASPRQGYTVRMTLAQRDAFLEGYRNGRMMSV
ncbi:hypothetical protein PENSPDRAFT_657577 [Peniophora sp. CONT]|nr:hypothetical protein PENSPDRAFT_657577 [Peniophora sp. CONT]